MQDCPGFADSFRFCSKEHIKDFKQNSAKTECEFFKRTFFGYHLEKKLD